MSEMSWDQKPSFNITINDCMISTYQANESSIIYVKIACHEI